MPLDEEDVFIRIFLQWDLAGRRNARLKCGYSNLCQHLLGYVLGSQTGVLDEIAFKKSLEYSLKLLADRTVCLWPNQARRTQSTGHGEFDRL